MTHYYFAYGSNMDADQMFKRVGSANMIGMGMLTNSKLFVSHRSRNWKGGVFSITENNDSHVNGVVYGLSEDELRILDRYEGRPTVYDREKMVIQMDSGRRVYCWVYYSLRLDEDVQISNEYLYRYLEACKKVGIIPSFT